MNIGFIGTGHMGAPMVRNLMKAGHRVTVCDVVPEATRPLIAEGALGAESPKGVAQACRLVLSSLPGPPEVEAVVLGQDGILAGAQAGDVYIDLSTNSPTVIRRLAAIAKEKGVTILDAPVSGGVEGATKGTLSLMVGGDPAAFEAHRPVLECIGSKIFYLGEVGNGNVAKLANNLISQAMHCVAAEGMVLGVKAGLAPQALREVVVNSSGRCSSVESYPRNVFQGNFEPGFMVDLSAKDLLLAVTLGKEVGVPVPVAAAALQRMVEAQARGLGRKANLSVITLLEEVAGVRLRVP